LINDKEKGQKRGERRRHEAQGGGRIGSPVFWLLFVTVAASPRGGEEKGGGRRFGKGDALCPFARQLLFSPSAMSLCPKGKGRKRDSLVGRLQKSVPAVYSVFP